MEDIFKQSSNKFFIIKYKTRGQADQSLNNKVIFLQKRFDQQLRNAAQVCEQVGVFLSCLDQKSFIAFGTIQNEPTDFDYLTEEQQQNLSKLQEFFQSFVKVEWIFKGVLNFEKTKNIKNDLNEMKPVNHCKDVQELTCQTAEQLLSLLQKQKPYKPQPQQDIRIPHQLNNLLMKNFGENDSDKQKSSKSRSRHREKEKDKDKVQDKDRTKSSKENDRRSRDRKSKERSQRRSKENKKNSYEKKDYREDKSQNIQEFVIDDNKDQREKERQTRDKEYQKDKDQREHRERDRSKEQKDQREQREKEREKEQRQLKELEKRERDEKEMIEKLKQKEKEKEKEREREKEKEKERDKERDRERQRDKDYNREREKFDKGRYDKKDDYKYRDWKDSKHEYDKKEKGKERERERDKNREKSKERSFEKSDRKERERRKEKERSRGDDKERERDYNNHKRQKDYRRETIKKRSEERSKPRSRSKERNQDHNSNKNEKALDIASYSEQQRELFSSVSLQSHKYEQQQQDFELEESSKLPKQKDEVDLGDILNVLDSPKKNNQQFQPLIQPVIIAQSEQLVLTKQSESYQSNNLNSDSKKRILVVNQEKNQSILDNVEQQKQQSSGSMKIIKDAPAKIIQQITNQQSQIQKSVVFQEAKQGSGNSIKDRIILKKK